MKKIITLTALSISLISMTNDAEACTSLLVGKKASTDGSTFITYAAASHVLYGELYHFHAKK